MALRERPPGERNVRLARYNNKKLKAFLGTPVRLQGLGQWSVWMLLATLVAGCATQQQRHEPPAVAGARALPSPAAPAAEVANALLPPLRAEMPRLPGSRAEGRFDLGVDAVPARDVFMSLVAGTDYSMVVHPYVGGTITLSLKDVTVAEALRAIRETYGYEYREEDRRIYVLPAGLQTRIYAAGDVLDRRPHRAGAAAPVAAGVPRPAFWEELERSLRDLVGSAEGRQVVTNARSGLIAVRAMPVELRAVESYLDALRFSTERQIVIEARIAEVTLPAGGRRSVNWPSPAALRNDAGGRILQAGDFEQTLAFLQSQGQVRMLASPRLMVSNNRKAVVRVGTEENRVSQIQAVPQLDPVSGVQRGMSLAPTLTPHFSGVSLEITPSYSEQAVTLHVHPVFSRVEDGVLRFNFGAAGEQELRIARTAISETDTVVRVPDGGIVAISGLTQPETGSAGPAREWVILVKATAVPGVWQGSIDLGDRRDAGGLPAGQENRVRPQ